MYAGYLGNRYHVDDPNQVGHPQRERTGEEQTLITGLAGLEVDVRLFLMSLPNDCDRRATATALTKLDELVMWAKRAIDS